MKLYPERLSQHLQGQLLPIYLLSGDEPLLISEAQSQIFTQAKQLGFDERQVHHAASNQDWYTIANDYQSLSLFSDKAIIDIRLTTSKFSDASKSCLKAMTDMINPDKVIIITCPKIESQTIRTKWFKALESVCGFIQFWPVTKTQFPAWLSLRLRGKGITLSKTGLSTLATLTQGNLLAADQAIHRLHLLYGSNTIDDEQLMAVISDHAQAELYQLLDDILVSDAKSISRTLKHLAEQGTEPILVLWLLSKEIHAYLALLRAKALGEALSQVFQSLQIWPKKQSAYHVIFSRHQEQNLLPLLTSAYQIDLMIKGLNKQNPWDGLLRLALLLAGINL